MNLIQGDCLVEMDKLINQEVKVDAIIADIPYGTTQCKWDVVIPFNNYIMVKKRGRQIAMYKDEWVVRELENTDKSIQQCRDEFDSQSSEGMWQKLDRLIKPNGAIVLFGSEPFSSALRMSNIKNYKYDWVWDKNYKTGHFNAKNRPLKTIENVLVFSNKKHLYKPQGLIEVEKKMVNSNSDMNRGYLNNSSVIGNAPKTRKYTQKQSNYPIEIIKFKSMNGNKIHTTQKPVALMEYLIKTYTNESEIVLDFTMGSGTTGVACKNLNRDFIGIELDKGYFDNAKIRIENV